jgi:hypothetical protein
MCSLGAASCSETCDGHPLQTLKEFTIVKGESLRGFFKTTLHGALFCCTFPLGKCTGEMTE